MSGTRCCSAAATQMSSGCQVHTPFRGASEVQAVPVSHSRRVPNLVVGQGTPPETGAPVGSVNATSSTQNVPACGACNMSTMLPVSFTVPWVVNCCQAPVSVADVLA